MFVINCHLQLEMLRVDLATTQEELQERQQTYQSNMAVLTNKLREVAEAREAARRELVLARISWGVGRRDFKFSLVFLSPAEVLHFMACRQPTPGRHNGRPVVGCLQGKL
jgi:hypothetical protein